MINNFPRSLTSDDPNCFDNKTGLSIVSNLLPHISCPGTRTEGSYCAATRLDHLCGLTGFGFVHWQLGLKLSVYDNLGKMVWKCVKQEVFQSHIVRYNTDKYLELIIKDSMIYRRRQFILNYNQKPISIYHFLQL